jgi:TetR/AcrR family transcriptional regulator, lmrAB and yxaGH operons repressor
MSGDARRRMIESAVVMLATRGLQGTSFTEVLEHSGAPRGSVYHHFPGGKAELVAAAIAHASERALAFVEKKAGASALEVTAAFLEMWRRVLTASKLEAGCSVLAVAVAADTPALRESAAAVFRAWRARLGDLLQRGGLSEGHAKRFAATLISASEGAVAMSRAEKDLEAFELTAALLLEEVEHLARSKRRSAGARRTRQA